MKLSATSVEHRGGILIDQYALLGPYDFLTIIKAKDEKTIFYTTAQEFVASVREMIQAGANFIGACCGSDQEFVKEIRKVVEGA